MPLTNESDVQVTSEEIPRGGMPDWLTSHLTTQSIGPVDDSESLSRILIIYPTESSRRQTLSEILATHAVDKTLHQTIDSLRTSLLADLRVPRILGTEAPFEIILHEECSKAASDLAFPLINPLPDMNWGRGKTAALTELHTYLSEESSIGKWDGPGIASFRRVIQDLEKRLGGTHPDMATQRVIEGLRTSETPFTLLDVDGILMLDHPPGLPSSDIDMLLAISTHRPIHQLTHPGNYRLGHHGMTLLIDQYPITDSSQLPDWIPPHQPENIAPSNSVTRLLLQREEHSFDAAITLASEYLEASHNSSIAIIDPALSSNLHKWSQRLKSIGVDIPKSKKPCLSHTVAHWIRALANLPHGANAFCLQDLRSLSLQSAILPFVSTSEHPNNSRILPIADPEVLTRLAREDHVLGGPGTLGNWLRTLSRPIVSQYDQISKESTQWWLLCLAESLRPLLNKEDLQALSEEGITIGCESGELLPLPNQTVNGDDWLYQLLRSLDLQSLMEFSDGEGITPAAVIQAIIRDHQDLRSYQSSLGLNYPESGPDWVDEFDYLLTRSEIETGPSTSQRLSLLTPSDSLGCTADYIIMANLSSSSWDLSVPRLAFLGEEERHSEDLLRPDGPIRDARHYFESILASANEVILLDPSLDDTSPPAAPLREWIAENDPKNEAKLFTFNPESPLNPRGERQLEGVRLSEMKPAHRAPLNPNSITIPLDAALQRDRERRQPKHTDDDGYLPSSARPHLMSAEVSDFSRTTPRNIESPRYNQRWPVIGGFVDGGKKSPSIDYRPLLPHKTGSTVSDARHGHLGGAEQNIEIWSPSRLHDWLRCPRMGWLSKSLRVDQDERQSEDIDPRTHGELLHLVHHDMICNALGMEIGIERQIDDDSIPLTVASSGFSEEQLMRDAMESLDSRAPWLDRTDAVSNHRLRILTGLERNDWNDWLADPSDIAVSGRIGTIVRAEGELSDAAPICIEWDMSDFDEKGIEISVPHELAGEDLSPIRIRGLIDRVDVLPSGQESEIWLNQDGDETVAPLRLHGSGWKPRRIIAIRDLKTSESKSAENRHSDGLLQELQLALYARAWEIAHPGDLVVAAGISLFSHDTEHMVEVSKYNLSEQVRIGTRTDITTPLFRFIDEDPTPDSDHFRAWLTHRLTVALRAARGASEGRVHPTPSEGVCSYCSVRNICDVRMEGRF